MTMPFLTGRRVAMSTSLFHCKSRANYRVILGALKIELKDYSDNDNQKASQTVVIGPGAIWVPISVPLTLSAAAGWTVVGTPDLSHAKLVALVVESRGPAVHGSIVVDDM